MLTVCFTPYLVGGRSFWRGDIQFPSIRSQCWRCFCPLHVLCSLSKRILTSEFKSWKHTHINTYACTRSPSLCLWEPSLCRSICSFSRKPLQLETISLSLSLNFACSFSLTRAKSFLFSKQHLEEASLSKSLSEHLDFK